MKLYCISMCSEVIRLFIIYDATEDKVGITLASALNTYASVLSVHGILVSPS